MKDEDRTRERFIHELDELRQKVAYLETCLEQRKRAEEALRESESKYRFLYQESPSISLIIGEDGLVKDANKAALETLGYSPDEGIGKHALEFVVPEEREKTAALLTKAFRGEYIPESNEIEIYAKDGSIHTILFSPRRLVLYEDEGDKPARILVTGIDITARRQAEEEINKLLATIETAKEAINITSADGTITYTNDAMDELFGYEKGELIGKHASILQTGPTPEGEIKRIIEAIRKEGYWEGEIHNKRKDGSEFISYARISALKDKDGRIIHYLSTQHDITERRKIEEALKQSETEYRALFETTGYAKAIIEEDMTISKINKEFELISGYSRAEMEGKKKWTEFVAEEDWERVREYHRLRRVYEKAVPRSYEFHYLTKKGELRDGFVTVDLIPKTKRSIASIVDITDRKHAEEELRETRDYLENLFNYANAPIIVWDPSFTITRFNHAFEHLTGRYATEVVGQPLDILFPEDKREEAMTLIRRALAGERWETVEIPIRHTDGSIRVVLWNSATLYAEDDTTPIATIAQGQDITDRKQADEALRVSEMHLRETKDYLDNVIKSSADAIVVVDMEGIVRSWNKAAEAYMGYTADEVIGKSNKQFYADPEEADRIMERVLRDGELKNYRALVLRKDKKPVHISMSAALLRDKNGVPIGTVRVSRDITKEVELEESIKEERDNLNLIFENMVDGVYIVSKDYKVEFMNKILINEFGGKVGGICYEVFHNRNEPCPLCKNPKVMNGKTERWEWYSRRKHKTYDLIETPLKNIDGTISKLTIFREITDRKRAEEQIKASLREKEVLLRELHHRVKNNLQIISTLLYLQSGYIKDKEALEMFTDSQNRIKSMALIHNKLYQFKDLGKIDIAGYIRDLATDLFHSYGVKPDGIKLKINVHEVLLGVNTAIPCGLIINELVSNSLKHAFPDGKEGEIRIELLRSVNEHGFTLIVSDNGVGFPEDLDFRNAETLGLQLVITLVDQLNGTIELDRRRGTEFKITFAEL